MKVKPTMTLVEFIPMIQSEFAEFPQMFNVFRTARPLAPWLAVNAAS